MPSDHQLNKLIFFKDLEYSESTKKTYWGLYLNYIADLENKYEKDLGDFSQSIIDEYLQVIQYKSRQTINQVNAFINKYLKWYSEYYNVEQKKFNFLFEKQKEDWYLSKKDFFKMCNKMIENEELGLHCIIPLIFARYGILGKEAIYMRNVKWNDIDYENKTVTIHDTNNNIISNISIDEEFLDWMNILKQYEKALYKGEKVKNKYIIKSQIEKEEIINYSTVNTKSYRSFTSIKMKRISFTTLANCAIVDYLYSIYKHKRLKDNQELIEELLKFYPDVNVDLNKLINIKRLYVEATNNQNLNLMPTRKANSKIKEPYKKKEPKKSNILKEIVISDNEYLNSNNLFKNAIVKDEETSYIVVKLGEISKKIKIDEDIIDKIKKHKWYLNINNSVVTRIQKKDRLEIVYLSNFILGVNEYHKIGFRNGNKFDYTKENLIEL